jgi:hypothetical protein
MTPTMPTWIHAPSATDAPTGAYDPALDVAIPVESGTVYSDGHLTRYVGTPMAKKRGKIYRAGGHGPSAAHVVSDWNPSQAGCMGWETDGKICRGKEKTALCLSLIRSNCDLHITHWVTQIVARQS